MRIAGNFFKAFVIFLMTILSSPSAFALDLPKKKINGKEYFYYTVQPKETIYSLPHKLGLSRADIQKYNPSIIDGLKAYDTLYFPVSEFAEIDSNSTTNDSAADFIFHKVKKGETIYGISRKYNVTTADIIAYNPTAKDGIKSGETLKIPLQPAVSDTTHTLAQEPSQSEVSNEEVMAAEESNSLVFVEDSTESPVEDIAISETPQVNIAVMLPFMLDQSNPNRLAQLYTEFYKGTLIAVDEMKEQADIHLYAFDTSDSLGIVTSIINTDASLKNMDVIIAPNDNKQIEAISQFASDNGIHVINIFELKNNSYISSKAMLQALIPQDYMYDKVIDYFVDYYAGYTPVFLKNLEKLSDKTQFTDALKARLDREGKKYSEIRYNDVLTDENIARLDSTKNYVFIPTSGSRADLSNIASSLSEFHKSCPNTESAKLFGYPEWITFKGKILEKMHQLNTVIYSRFGAETESEHYSDFTKAFRKWYGSDMLNVTPKQGLLGYDTTMFIIRSVINNSEFEPTYNYTGIQNTFNFSQSHNIEGFLNKSLYFIQFSDSGETRQTTK